MDTSNLGRVAAELMETIDESVQELVESPENFKVGDVVVAFELTDDAENSVVLFRTSNPKAHVTVGILEVALERARNFINSDE